jgi:hypothetical protein
VRISIVAMGLLMATGGLLQPIRSSVESSRAEVERLQQELARSGDLPRERRRLQQELDSILQEIQQRAWRLCPDTPEAQHEFESSLLEAVQDSGLESVRMDRRSELLDGRHACLTIEMVVDGDAYALHQFLLAVERLPWVTRVLSLAIDPGAAERRITVQIALILEPSS